MNPISDTAYYCCGIRMEDAERKPSVCNDRFAKRFMDERGMRIYQPFRSETMPNISNIARCRIIDELIANELSVDAESHVITIGAGFDTRPYRLTGGNWVEVDEMQIIDQKNERLPTAECPNSLTRIAIDFSVDSLTDKLAPIRNDKPIVIVLEGVLMYLEPESIEDTLGQLRRPFPTHLLMCDLMTRKFFQKFSASVPAKLVAAAAARFTERPENPAEIFMKNAYVETAQMPMFRRAAELGVLWERARIPTPVAKLLLGFFMRDLNGYAVHRFAYGSVSAAQKDRVLEEATGAPAARISARERWAAVLIAIAFTVSGPAQGGIERAAIAVLGLLTGAGFLWRSPPVTGAGLASLLFLLYRLPIFAGLWPLPNLLSLALLAAAYRAIPALRASATWARVGQTSPAIRRWMVVYSVVPAVALVVWRFTTTYDLGHFRDIVPPLPHGVVLAGLIVYAAFNAIYEEVFFRGVLMEALDSATGAGALFLQAIVFGALHYRGFPGGEWGVALATVYGVMMGHLRRKSGGLLAPVIAHVVADAVIFTMVALMAFNGD